MPSICIPLAFGLSMRPVQPSDKALTRRIYHDSRWDLRLAEAPRDYIHTVTEQQADLRDDLAGAGFPERRDFIIEQEGAAIGHLMLAHNDDEIWIVSLRFIAIVDGPAVFRGMLPALQSGAIGSRKTLHMVVEDLLPAWGAVLADAGFVVEARDGLCTRYGFVPPRSNKSYFFRT